MFRRPRVSEVITTKAQREGVLGYVSGKAHTTSRQMRSAGKLSRFADLPLDAIYQIVVHLKPIDLLQLTRVSQQFRQIFMTKYLWIAARGSLPGLPECPFDLNESQYASLLFENKCQACGCNCKSASVDYSLRIRACEECHNELVSEGEFILAELEIDASNRDKVKHVFYRLAPRSTRHLVEKPLEYLRNLKETPSCHDNFFVPELRAVIADYLSVLKTDDDGALESFVKRREEAAGLMYQSALDILIWRHQHRIDQDREEALLAQSREAQIIKKLEMFSWKGYPIPKFGEEGYEKWTQLVRQPQPLTDQEWARIAPELLALLDHIKGVTTGRFRPIPKTLRDKRVSSLRAIWPKFVEEYLSEDLIIPPIDFICEHIHSVKLLLGGHGEYDEIDMDQLLSLLEAIETDLVNARKKIRAELLSLHFPDANDESILDHPSTLFCCRMCNAKFGVITILSSNELLRHNCTSNWGLEFMELYRRDQTMFLEALKVINWNEGMDIREFDGRLRCNCGHPYIAGKNLTFTSLINHVHSERLWCHAMKQKWSETSSHELINDHTVGDLAQLLQVLPPEKIMAATNDVVPPRIWVSFGKESCLACDKGTNGKHREFFPDDSWRAYHLRAKHKLEDIGEHVIPWKT